MRQHGMTRETDKRLTRRTLLQVGGVSLTALLGDGALQAASAKPHKSVIMIFLPGGPSHLDTVDLKPDAPSEIRGPFRPINTRVPGISLCEHMPQLASVMDKLVILRSIVGAVDDHASHMCLTGHSRLGPQPAGNWPSFGSAVSRIVGPVHSAAPPFVGLAATMLHPPYNDPGPGFLGAGHGRFTPDQQAQENLLLQGVDLTRLRGRHALLVQLDRLRRDLDTRRAMDGVDAINRRALNLITAGVLRDALDLTREDSKTVSRYGKGDPSLVPGLNAAPRMTEHLLMARRLVEAGVRVVTLAFGAWDWHEKNFIGHQDQLPLLDHGLTALVEDLHARGLERDVLVVAWGEFSRTPRINNLAGRDHWPAVTCAILAGGGIAAGQIIGTTTRLGEYAKDRPVPMQQVLATVYHHLGVDVSRVSLPDFAGRPQYLLEQQTPIAELY